MAGPNSDHVKLGLIKGKGKIIHNGGSPANRNARRLCLSAFEKALEAVDPFPCVKSSMKVTHEHLVICSVRIPRKRFRDIFILAAGKASASMMHAALQTLRDIPSRGILVTSKSEEAQTFDSRVETFRAGHPIPDRAGQNASQRIVEDVGSLDEDELLLCLISGGASAMLPAPAKGITLGDKIRMTEELLKSRANIHEINTVRRHLSSLKGGRLIELCRASRVCSLIISDVPGNCLQDIGSGLTVGDPTSFHDAVQILKRHQLWEKAPYRVKSHLLSGVRGLLQETPKPGNPMFRKVHNMIIADNRSACAAALWTLRKRKLRSRIMSTTSDLEAREMGLRLASAAAKPSMCKNVLRRSYAMIAGGECVVHLTGKGEGGRNQEMALAAVDRIQGLDGSVIAALGTDGIDGNTKAAGAIVDGNTARRARLRRLDPDLFLARNDSGNFFKQLGDALVTGPTGTNVGDIYLMISLG